MDFEIILLASIVLQFAAVILALRLIPVTESRLSWLLISAAILLMAIRRCITLYHVAAGDMPCPTDVAADWVALGTSGLMLAGIALIGPLFRTMNQSAEALKTSEEKYRLLVETMNDGLIVVDDKERTTYANNRLCEMWGYPREELIGRSIYDLLDEPNLNILHEQNIRRRQGGRDPYEIEWTGADGRRVPTLVSPVPILDSRGRFVGSSAVITDISMRKSVERALENRERYFRSLIENATDLITILDENGLIRYESPAVERVLGYRPQELVGQNVFHLLHPLDLPKAHRLFAELLRAPGDERSVECRFRHADGSWRVLEATGRNLLDDSAVRGVIINSRDVTIRKTAEQTLRESEEKYRTLFHNSKDAIFVTAQDGRLIDVNQAATSLFGYRREHLLGMQLADLCVDPEHLGLFRQEVERSGSLADFAVRLRRKDCTIMDCLLTATVRQSASGDGCGLQGIIRDVTSLKRMEEQLRLSQRLEAIGRLAGGVAHDFNNLLTAIMGYADFLLYRLQAGDRLHDYASQISKAAARAADLTRQLLAFSRQQVLQPKVIELNHVVLNLDKMLRRLIGENIDLAAVLSPDLGRVKADPSQIEQVIMNLVLNARDAMPRGGRLTIETKNVELDQSYVYSRTVVQPGPYVMLAVSDTGCGMDEETLLHIFEPFFTTKDKGKGTGLGLATVYGIVKQSDGYIWVYSEPGKGATFKVYLPAVEDLAEPVRSKVLETDLPRGDETVLIVEDEDAVRRLMHTTLQASGYTVLGAHHGDEALTVCKAHPAPIHLLITDVIMPGMTGRQLADALCPLRPETKVLYISGYADNGIVWHGILDEGMEFLQKPFTPDQLIRKVREVLDG